MALKSGKAASIILNNCRGVSRVLSIPGMASYSTKSSAMKRSTIVSTSTPPFMESNMSCASAL